MDRLSSVTLGKLKSGVAVPAYNKASVTVGIIHFGTGNFHRAHQAVYCDALLNTGETRWGITGVSMRSSNMRDKLLPQDFLYTQATLGDKTDYRIIGAIQNLLVAPENPQAVIEAVADAQIQLVTTTITEKGYCLSSGKIDRDHQEFTKDLESLTRPQTIYGYLTAALINRCLNKGGPLTILCCDNIHAGGEHLRQGVQMLLELHSPETLSWVNNNVVFSSSMVDRVTPATSEALKDQVAEHLGLIDAAPVAAEPYTQWVIENRFAGERPAFDQVGALFVDDIVLFEQIKLRFLNAAHSMLATLGYLFGDRFVHESMQRPNLAKFAEQALKLNVLPVTTVPASIDVEAYIDQVFERFRNSRLPYAVLQVGTDSSQKIQQRWFPSIDDALAQDGEFSYLAFTLAAWVSYIQKALVSNDLNDPLKSAFADVESKNAFVVKKYLNLAGVEQFAFSKNNNFMQKVEQFHLDIEKIGVEKALLQSQAKGSIF